MKAVVADHARDWLTWFLAGLGITFAPHEWIGGLFLALAAATFSMRMDPERDQRELWVVLFGAFLASHLAALCAHVWFPDLPKQLVMVGAGFFSRHIARFGLRLGGLVEDRSDVLADRIVDKILPDDDRNHRND